MEYLRARSVLALIGLAGVLFSTALAAEMRAVVATVPVGQKLKRVAVNGGGGSAVRRWHFEGDVRGSVPAGWRAETGTWQVLPDPTGSGNVFAQVSGEHAGSYFNVAICEEPSLRNVAVRVRLRARGGDEDQGGGPVWRYRDVNNYYIARYNPLEDNYRVYKVVNGRRILLASADVEPLHSPSHSLWQELAVRMDNDAIQCFLDGKLYLEVKDSTFEEAGHVGLWTKADAQTDFDDFEVEGK